MSPCCLKESEDGPKSPGELNLPSEMTLRRHNNLDHHSHNISKELSRSPVLKETDLLWIMKTSMSRVKTNAKKNSKGITDLLLINGVSP